MQIVYIKPLFIIIIHRKTGIDINNFLGLFKQMAYSLVQALDLQSKW